MCNALHENAHEKGSNPIVMASNLLEMAFKLIDKTKEAKGPSFGLLQGRGHDLKGDRYAGKCLLHLFVPF